MYQKIDHCRLCKTNELQDIINLGEQAFTGIFPKSANEDIPLAPLKLVKCANCDLVQLGNNFDMSMLYGEHYGYRSGLNNSMVLHLRSIANRVTNIANPKDGDIIIDIGSNDSTLLKNYSQNAKLLGFDPSGLKFKEFYPEHVALIPDFFSNEIFAQHYPNSKAQIITSIAMFYDLEEPQKFVDDIAKTLDKEGIWAFEQSYLPFMLKTNSFDTICHEHLEYYSLKQVRALLDKADLKIIDVDFNNINGGSFMVIAAHKNSSHQADIKKLQQTFHDEEALELGALNTYKEFETRLQEQKTKLLDFIKSVKSQGKLILGYGASTKGNVLLQYYGLTSQEIPFIVEVNEDKFGAFTPGTKIPIISEAEGRAMNPDYFLVLPWHFKDFIVTKEQAFIQENGKLIFPLPELEIIGQ